LKHSDRIVRAEDCYGRSKQDAPGPAGDRSQYHLGRRNGEIGAMMFAHAKSVDSELIGKHAFCNYVAQCLRLRHMTVVLIERNIAERIQAEFNHRHPIE
jgi:hypothetical protein